MGDYQLRPFEGYSEGTQDARKQALINYFLNARGFGYGGDPATDPNRKSYEDWAREIYTTPTMPENLHGYWLGPNGESIWGGEMGGDSSFLGKALYSLFNEQAAPYTLTAIVGGMGALGAAGAGGGAGGGAAGAGAEAGATSAAPAASLGVGLEPMLEAPWAAGGVSAGLGGAGELASGLGSSATETTLGSLAKQLGTEAAKSLAKTAAKGLLAGTLGGVGGSGGEASTLGSRGSSVSTPVQTAARQTALSSMNSPYSSLITRYLNQKRLFQPIGG